MTSRAVIMLLLGASLLPSPSAREHARAEPASATRSASGAKHMPLGPRSGPDGTGFDPRTVVLDPASPEARMRALIANNDSAGARALALGALPQASEPSRGRIAWLLAASSAPDARAALESLYTSSHPLQKWAGLRLAERLQTEDPPRAATIALALSEGWAGAERARTLHALSLAQGPALAEAEARLRALLPSTGSGAAIALPLAELLAKKADRNATIEAIELCRRVSARAPSSRAAARADALLRTLLAKLPKKERAARSLEPARVQLERAQGLYDGRSYEAARALLERVLTRLDKPGASAFLDGEAKEPLRCELELLLGRTLSQLKLRKESAEVTAPLAQRCADPELRAWARYYAGQARLRSGDPQGAVNVLQGLLAEAPDSSLCDDALTMQATAFEDLADSASQRRTLATLVERYPDGDMWVDAAFSLAMLARARGEHGVSIVLLERMIASDQDERTEGAEGRAFYWRARALQDQGKRSEAVAGYEQLVRSSLLGSYYSQQALARLSELSAHKAKALLGTAAPAQVVGSPRFAERPELHAPGFAATLELLRVGEIELALFELAALGATRSNADTELAWLAAALLDAAGAHAEANRVARPLVAELVTNNDLVRRRQLLRIAYPHAFTPVLENAAAEATIPPSLVRAIAREESAFDPEAVSPARAYGLVQLIVPTARTFARPLGLPSHPAALKQPAINLRIGSQLLRSLLARYGGHAALVPAAYNAGAGAADRWLAGARGQALDEFIEAIPYRETRRYTRRVLQSYGLYSLLDEGRLPVLPARLPE